MDRQIVYPGQILPETSLLQMAKDAMIGSAKLAAAMLGTSTIANGFAVTPTGPASLQIVVAPGEIYSLANIDSLAFSTLPADTTHSILKQGILLDGVTLSCPAPTTTGQSINYLIQVTYQDQDSAPVLLPYYNSSNPALPYSGMGNNGLTQNTSRKGAAIAQVKAGASAATGSQSTPAPDIGYIGLYVVTVTFGQTTITSANIAQYGAAPLLPSGLIQSVQSGNVSFAIDSGTANAYSCSFSPAITTRVEGQSLRFKVKTANTGASTFNDGLGAVALLGGAHSALQGGELVASGDAWVQWNSSVGSGAGSYVLLFCTGAAEQVANGTKSQHAVALGQTPTETLGGAPLVATQAMVTAGTDDTAYVTAKKLAAWFTATFAQATELVAGIAKIATQAQTNTGTDDATIVTPKKLKSTLDQKMDKVGGDFSGAITAPTATLATLEMRGLQPYIDFSNDPTTDYDARILLVDDDTIDILGVGNAGLRVGGATVFTTAAVATQAQVNAGTDDATVVTPKKLRAGFQSSFTSNGYIAFPTWLGGLIIQWGRTALMTDAGSLAVTLPMTFPSSALQVWTSLYGSVAGDSGNCRVSGGQITSTSQILITYNETNATLGGSPVSWLAIGL